MPTTTVSLPPERPVYVPADKPTLINLQEAAELACAEAKDGASVESLRLPFDQFAKSNDCKGIVNSELVDILNNPANRSCRTDGRYILFRNQAFRLSLLLLGTTPGDNGSAFLTTEASDRIIAVITGKVHLRRYQPPSEVNLSIFDPKTKFLKTYDEVIEHGSDSVLFRVGDVIDWHYDRPCVVASLACTRTATYTWTLDHETLHPTRILASTPHVSRWETVIDLMICLSRKLGPTLEIKQTLKDLTKSPLHFIRWKAIEALFSIDQSLGLIAVKEAIKDPHPHVASAARSSLIALSDAGIAPR